MKAMIRKNLMDVIDEFFGGTESHRTDPEFIKLCDRISGKVVNLNFIGKDAFEDIDDDYWLPDCCWDEIKA